MKQFKLYNNIAGWVAFFVAAITYLMTIEPTASFWDCGEFAASAFKLEVGHPPGAPFFMMTGRIFSLFASDPTQVAAMINSMSALCSAFTILFLFWTITHIARRVVLRKDEDQLSLSQGIATLGAGMVGALAYTFSDTFWFSAVEGEVYAYSSFFTAIVFWCILKWEDASSTPTAARWLILIAYLMGLSIGVHLLNLLAIPAIVLVYYFKNYEVTKKNTLIALTASVAILGLVLYGMVPGFVKVASWFELLFVNQFGLGFNSGFLAYIIVVAGVLVWAIYQLTQGHNEILTRIAFILAITLVGIPFIGDSILLWIVIMAAFIAAMFVVKQWNKKVLHLIVMCSTVMLIGYSSYAMIVVRSLANTPMDQNSPEDVFTLQSFLNREQYGDRPLLYGGLYCAPEVRDIKGNQCVARPIYGAKQWQKVVKTDDSQDDKYICVGRKQKGFEKDSRFEMLFPRMYSSQGHHVEAYKAWADIKGKTITADICGRTEDIVMPTFGENLKFFFRYQVNFMYLRYFLWNFSGRQNDLQSHGERDHGNWITGISFIDNAMYGDLDAQPESARDNKGRNKYYLLPLLLGIFGIMWQLKNKKQGSQSFWIVFTLFFMTGLAIVVYLNQTPYQPRERDYAYAGSFYAFSIWIGLGVMFLYDLLSKAANRRLAAAVATLVSLGVPVLMAAENWDDHDRSNRYVARDSGWNYLNSCEENAIIYSNGDNDTFPLWYNQEVEGNRTDVRVCNLSYLQTDWYAEQMKREAYESAPLPISWEKQDFAAGHLEYAQVFDHPQFGGRLDVKTAFKLMRDPRFINEGVGTIFASTLTIPVDKAAVLRSGTVAEKDSALIVDELEIKLGGHMTRSQMMFLEILASNNWERPIYVSATVGDEFYPNVKEYLQLEGLAYRIVPIKTPSRNRVNTDVMYDNMMNKFRYGNFNGDIYIDEQHSRTGRTIRMMFNDLASELISEGKNDKARKVLDRCMEELPKSAIGFDHSAALLGESYYRLGEYAIADSIMLDVANDCEARIQWVLGVESKRMGFEMNEFSSNSVIDYWKRSQMRTDKALPFSSDFDNYRNVAMLQNIWRLAVRFKSDIEKPMEEKLQTYFTLTR